MEAIVSLAPLIQKTSKDCKHIIYRLASGQIS